MSQRIGLGLWTCGVLAMMVIGIRGYPPAHAEQIGDVEHAIEVGRSTTPKDVEQDGRINTLEATLREHLSSSEKRVDNRTAQVNNLSDRVLTMETYQHVEFWALSTINVGGIMTLVGFVRKRQV